MCLVGKGGKKAIQTILIENDKYILSSYQGASQAFLYITNKKDLSYVTGKYRYQEVGFGSGGKKSLAEIKKYFKDCDEAMSIIDGNLEHNKGAKRMRMVLVLQGVMGISCE